MPLKILRPLATSATYNSMALAAGASMVAAVDTGDPVAHDDSTSYLTSNNQPQAFTLTGKPSPPFRVNSVKTGCRHIQLAGGPSAGARMRLGGVDSATLYHSAPGGSWTTPALVSHARPGGGAWTDTDIGAATLEMFFWNDVIGASAGFTSMWVELDYSTPGGFVFFMLSVAPFVGAGLGLVHMPRLAAALARGGGGLLLPQEYAQALREWNAWRRPAFAF